MNPVRVMIIDDSAIVRELLTVELSRYPDIRVTASANDPFIARDKLARTAVDVILLDIEMPRMDGLTFLKYLMRYHPVPVIILSSIVERNTAAGLQALELGAVDIIPKPGGPFSVVEVLGQLADRIRAAREIDFERVKASVKLRKGKAGKREPVTLSTIETTNRLIAIGASTGGTVALEHLFTSWTASLPPTLAVIHMPERFTAAFAKRLNEICAPTVKEAEDGETALPGCIYIAPGNLHMTMRTAGSRYIILLKNAPRIHGQRPAVDPLFHSVGTAVGRNAVGVLLTGMGKDGAAGLLAIREHGGHTICQDEQSCVVFGMPKAAIDLGAAETVLPLTSISAKIREFAGG